MISLHIFKPRHQGDCSLRAFLSPNVSANLGLMDLFRWRSRPRLAGDAGGAGLYRMVFSVGVSSRPGQVIHSRAAVCSLPVSFVLFRVPL